MGDTCTFNHDLVGRMLQRDYRTFANSPSGPIADSDVFTFDKASRMLTGHSGRYNNDVGMGYDFGGRLSSESLTIAGQTYTVGRTYDTRGLEASMTYPNGSLVERTYSPRQQLHQTKYLGTVVDARTYDSGGRHATSTYANGAVTTNAYRLDNLLSSRATTHAGTEQIGTYSYTWDANKNKTGEAITGTMAGYGFTVPANGYDHEDRVTAWNRQDGNKNQSWNLSLVGDWNTHTDAGVTQTRTHGPAHEFTSVTIGGNNHALSYDPKGNMLTRPAALSAPALNLVWDFENQLKGADIDGTPASLEVTFEFDALGRRVARNEGSSQIVFVQAGQQTIADYARSTPSSSPTYRYVYASYIDEPILRHTGTLATLPTTGTDTIYFHHNQQYSITALTDAAGTLIERYAYTGYGIMSILAPDGTNRSSSSFANRYTYTGREWDRTLAMYYFRARCHDPSMGLFVGRDPLGYFDSNLLYLNQVALSGFDPFGLCAYECCINFWDYSVVPEICFETGNGTYCFRWNGAEHVNDNDWWIDILRKFVEGVPEGARKRGHAGNVGAITELMAVFFVWKYKIEYNVGDCAGGYLSSDTYSFESEELVSAQWAYRPPINVLEIIAEFARDEYIGPVFKRFLDGIGRAHDSYLPTDWESVTNFILLHLKEHDERCHDNLRECSICRVAADKRGDSRKQPPWRKRGVWRDFK